MKEILDKVECPDKDCAKEIIKLTIKNIFKDFEDWIKGLNSDVVETDKGSTEIKLIYPEDIKEFREQRNGNL